MINDIVRSLPNGLGYGTMAWEPTRVLFDKEGNADKDLFGIYDALYKQYIKSDVQPVYEPPYVNTDTIRNPLSVRISLGLPNQEQRGIVFSHNGVQKDALKILKENGFNWIRLRLFVVPYDRKGIFQRWFLWVGIHSIHGQAYKGCWHEIPARFPLQRYMGRSWPTGNTRIME